VSGDEHLVSVLLSQHRLQLAAASADKPHDSHFIDNHFAANNYRSAPGN
jgi:hypothetical protein